MTRATKLFLLVTLGVTSASAGAAPTGREVVAVCERALARGFQGIDAAMCAWYTAPCECKIETASRPETEQWCLAPDMPEERMVRDVLARLRAHPSLNAPVDTLVPGILADLYPCR